MRHATPARCGTVGVTSALLLAFAAATFADDIELFISTDAQAEFCDAPNVLFLIDTSSSMDAAVETQPDYDPGQEYSGCFESNYFYFSSAGTVPECSSTHDRFTRESNQCIAIQGTEYTGEFQAWDSETDRWTKLEETSISPGDFVECADDEGVHGDGTPDEVYAIDNYVIDGVAEEGPWSANPFGRISWGANASAGTVYDGNWLNWLQSPPDGAQSRMEVVQEVAKATLDNMSEANVALMAFNFEEGGSVLHALEALDQAREPMKTVIDGLTPDGATPVSESLYELGQYLRGGTVDFGEDSVAESRLGGAPASTSYASPLNNSGQNTYIVLLTDGEPSGDISANRLIEGLPDYDNLVGQPCDDAIDGSCLDAMAEYLYKADLRTDVPGQQNVITHTIGFQVDYPLLASTAERGGGRYFVADDTAGLTQALSDITDSFARSPGVLTAPQIPINAFNAADRLDDVYVSVFQPAATQHWPGNVKKYRRQQTDSGEILIDANGNNALDPSTGYFSETAVSFWSNPTVDGGEVTLGGAASRLPAPSARKILSNIGGLGLAAVKTDNPNITAALIGAPEADRDATIEWARGIDSRDADEDGDTTEPRLAIGDPLHVQPVTVTYGSDPTSANAIVFVATNDGYLHAFDATTGTEIWAFIPRRLLSRLYELSLNEPAPNKTYGLDGELSVVETNGRTVLVFGMRRGGKAIYALDVTSRTAPSLLWVIDNGDASFPDLGQTWSPAVVARVGLGGGARDVLLFGGGYDAGQDNGSFRADSQGNAIYMVNAATGALEWSAGGPNARGGHDLDLARMNFSIPAGLRVVDSDGDGLDDRVYFGDMGGQIWRIDFINGNGRANFGEGGVLASLGAFDTGARADARRFYNTPDVVNIIQNDNLFVAINIGSGYQAHPLDTDTAEEFYSIRDFRPQEVIPTEDYGTEAQPIITRDELADVTDNLSAELETTDPGWRLSMESAGEKVLSSAITFDNVVFFTSFTPADSQGSCLPRGGTNRLYRVDILYGSVVPTNRDAPFDPADYTKTDRHVDVGLEQSAPQQTSIGSDGTACVGLDCFSGENAFAEEGDDGTGNGIGGPRAKGIYWFPVTQP